MQIKAEEISAIIREQVKSFEKQVDVAQVFATDGRVPAFDFVILKDDKAFFPAYALTPVIRKQAMDGNPAGGSVLQAAHA